MTALDATIPAIDELAAQGDRFVAWRWQERDGKRTKPPFSPYTGKFASCTDPSTWADLGTAQMAADRDRMDGVGFVLDAARDGIVGIDLDGCRDHSTGVIAAWALKIVRNINSYTEISPSGSGVKILLRADPVPTLRANNRTVGKAANGTKAPAVEIYTGGRYFCLTGNILDDVPDEIVDATVAFERLAAWVAKGIKPREERPKADGHDGDSPFRTINTAALAAPGRWVPVLFGAGARENASGVWRVSSKALGRDRQEDLSISPAGIKDFGEHDMGDPKQGRRTAIDLVMEHGGAGDPKAAAQWLADLLGIEVEMRRAPEAASVILDPADPYKSAAVFLARHYHHRDGRTLQRHRGSFYVYADTHYREMEAEEIRRRLYQFLEAAQVWRPAGKKMNGEAPAFELAPFKPNRNHVHDLVDTVRARAGIDDLLVMPCWLGQPGYRGTLIPVANGLLDPDTGRLHPHSPNYFQSYSLSFGYDPKAPEPTEWLRFLDSLWPDDEEARDTLQEIIGLLLTDDTRHHKLFMLVGPPRSGKGTIARVLQRMHGKENVAGPTLSSLALNFGLQELIGKPVAVISDARLSGRSDAAVIAERLLSISGEDVLTIDRKHRDPWTGTLPTRFLILTNELPRIADSSGALASRFVILMLTKSFLGREDHQLMAKLAPELSGIFNWALAGRRRLEQRGYFVMPKSSLEAVEEIVTLSSPVRAFIRDCCVIAHAAEEKVAVLYEQWRAWCSTQGRDRPGTVQSFGNDLRAALPHLKVVQHRDRQGDKFDRYYRGLRLQREAEPCP